MMASPLVVVASVTSGVAAGVIVWSLYPPPRRLRARVEPYLTPVAARFRGARPGSTVTSVFGPLVRIAAARLSSLVDRSGTEMTAVKLRQAGWHRDLPEEEAVAAYRVSQLKSLLLGLSAGLAVGRALSLQLTSLIALAGLGVVVGGTRQRSRVEKAIEKRLQRLRIEIYTIDQLLAMRVRAGGGVIQAVQATVARGSGEVVGELADALRLQRAGWSGADAFRRIAELTPDPYCGRTYRLLAAAEERGADLAGALLDLAEDVRESRRESIKRSATKRRAAMLIPTIAILAPVLILFVAAPLPYLITGWN